MPMAALQSDALQALLTLEQRLNRQLVDWRQDRDAAAASAVTAIEWSECVWRLASSAGPGRLAPAEVQRGLTLARRPVFICGVHRSGTTLMRDLLDGHPALSVLPAEGTFYTNPPRRHAGTHALLPAFGCEWLRRLVNPSNQPPFWLLVRSSSRGSPYVEFARAFTAWAPLVEASFGRDAACWPLLAVMLAYSSSLSHGIPPTMQRWAEKTPTNERFIDRLLREFPEARVLHLVRDPLAVFASRKSMELYTYGRFDHVGTALRELARSYRVALNRSGSARDPRYLLVRYEQLVNEQPTTTQRIAAFLRIEPLPVLWRPTVAGHATGSNSSFDDGSVKGRILNDTEHAPGDSLTPAERQLVAGAVGRWASRLGYPAPAASGWLARMRRGALR
ncbi:MAG: sulfotransferase family protein [Steroidobacteraceae bacterium]